MEQEGRTRAPPKRSNELESIPVRERHRQQVDDAKKRAVSQGENYEQFKQMAAAAHLVPLQQHFTNAMSNAPHTTKSPLNTQPPIVKPEGIQRSDGRDDITIAAASTTVQSALEASASFRPVNDTAPESVDDLAAALLRIPNSDGRAERVCDLLATSDATTGLASLLRVELQRNMADDLLVCLYKQCVDSVHSSGYDGVARSFISAFAQAPRASLTVKMLRRNTKEKLEQLIACIFEQDDAQQMRLMLGLTHP